MGIRRSERDVGPVPILRARLRLPVTESTWFETEVDGFYAPIKYINGGDSDVKEQVIASSATASPRTGSISPGFTYDVL